MSCMTNAQNDKQPKFYGEKFICPHPSCRTLAIQKWRVECYAVVGGLQIRTFAVKEDMSALLGRGIELTDRDLHLAECESCNRFSIWEDKKMIYPQTPSAPIAHQDMPDSVKEIYEEARNVEFHSKRAAAALLRVSLEKLTEELGETKGNLHTRISNLKEKGLPVKVINGLHAVRITGNDAVHSGQIDLNNEDNPEIVRKLFRIVNLIVEKTIGDEKEINEIFDVIPKEKKQGLEDHNNSN